ncbi:hypothetical protein HK101_002270, partial [Irineochytrium annulatum]
MGVSRRRQRARHRGRHRLHPHPKEWSDYESHPDYVDLYDLYTPEDLARLREKLGSGLGDGLADHYKRADDDGQRIYIHAALLLRTGTRIRGEDSESFRCFVVDTRNGMSPFDCNHNDRAQAEFLTALDCSAPGKTH